MQQPPLVLAEPPALLDAVGRAETFLKQENDYRLARDAAPVPNPLQGLWVLPLERTDGMPLMPGDPTVAVSRDEVWYVSSSPSETATIGLVYPDEIAAPESLTAAGFNEDQIRVPKGNGKLSGRWVDSPLSLVRDLTARANSPMRPLLRDAETSAEELQADLEFDGPDKVVERLGDVVHYLQEAITIGRPPDSEADSIREVIEKVEVLEGLDWSLFSDISDIGAEDEEDWFEETVNWGNFDRDTRISMTENAVAELQAGDDAAESEDKMDALSEAVRQGLGARVEEVLEEVGITGVTLRTNFTGSWDGQSASVGWTLQDESGQKVGTIERTVNGTYVTNEYLQLDRSLQGKGFGAALTKKLDDWYRDNGVSEVFVHANIDVGGFTWARQGFNWDPDNMHVQGFLEEKVGELVYALDGEGDLPRELNEMWTSWMLDRLGEGVFVGLGVDEANDLIDRMEDDLPEWDVDWAREGVTVAADDKQRGEELIVALWNELYGAGKIGSEEQELRDQIAEWVDQLGRGETYDITPYDIASFGQNTELGSRVDHQSVFGGADGTEKIETQEVKTWIGKRALLHSDWMGIKHLQEGW